MHNRHIWVSVLIFFVVSLVGCGYTSQTLLPQHVQSVHVARVVNQIDITDETSSAKAFRTYRPGLETEVRNALIERFIVDGHLKVKSLTNADAVLRMDLIEFTRDALRYNDNNTIEEFRIHIVASAEFIDMANNKTIWRHSSIAGDGDYFLSGELSKSEDTAVSEALSDLARHIVEDILEVW